LPVPALIVFDLDGTLVDSRRDLAASANHLLAELGAEPLPEAEIVAMVGEGARVLVQRVLAASRVDPEPANALERFLAIYERNLTVHTRPYAGIPEVLDLLTGRAGMAVLTNKPGRHTALLLDALDLSRYFTAGIVGGDAPWPRKPDPAGLAWLSARAASRPDQTLMVGDSWVDLETARGARIRFCHARYGFGRLRETDRLPEGSLVAGTTEELGRCLADFAAAARQA
jgi:phosphoglycolate phosphatase